MNRTLAVLSSSTLWTIVVTVLINAVPVFREFIPVAVLPFVDIILVALATYFHVGSVDKAYNLTTVLRGPGAVKRSY